MSLPDEPDRVLAGSPDVDADLAAHDLPDDLQALLMDLPPDYPVAVVSSVERPPGQAFALVTATPSARIDRSREVLLVWQQSRTQASEAGDE